MAESWTQNINKEIPWETSSNNNNLQIHNWGDRPSAPSENNWGAKKTVQEPWGPNKSENWASRNNIVEVDQSSWKNDEAISVSTYKQVNRHDEEEKLDSLAIQVSIEHSYESFKNVKEHQEIELDEDQYDPSYESVSSTSKSQLGKIATPFEDVTKYNISNRAEPLTTSSNSAFQEFQESHKVFRNVEVQTDTFDLSVIIASGEKLLSIGSQIKTVQDNIVSEKKNLPQQMSLLDMDWKTVENDSWNTTLSGDFREGTTVIPPTKPDISSHSEVTQFPWNSASRQASARSDNQDQQISVSDNQDAVSQQKPIQQKVLAQENAWGGMIPVEPDDWGTVQKTPVKEDTWTTQQKPIQQKAPAQENAWGTAPQQKQQKPLQEKAPAQENIMKPVQPDDWGTVQKSPATGETWPSQKGVISQPVQNNGWNPGSQKSLQSRPKDTVSQETSKESNENWGAASKPGDAWNKEPQNTGNTWDANNPPSTNDWIKKADLFAKELGESNQMKAAQSEGRKAKDSYNVGTNDSWNSNPSTGDWTKKADLYAKELGESNAAQSEDQKVKDSYNVGTNDSYYDNSSTNNRYGSRRCNTCGSEDHVARECPNKKCFKCGKEGHIGRECPESGAYGGYSGGRSCHKCGKEGHLARDCSESGGGAYGGGYGDICFKCNKPGHRSQDCKEDAHEITGEDGSYGSKSGSYTNGPPRNRMKSASPFSNPEPSDISSEEAWEKLLIADTKKDVDDFKDALELYAKATPGETFQTIEKKLRSANCNGRIIALERDEIPLTKVLVDLQGNRDKKYVASAIIGDPSRLAKTAGNRACSEEENFVWLANSGFMVDDTTPICFNCKQKGHITKDCQEPKKEIERPAILACQHCKSPEHMTKMCPERRDYYEEARDRRFAGGYRGENTARDEDRASSGYDDDSRKNSRYTSNQPCRNCNREGHLSRECPEPRRSGGVRRCHNCGKEGHISKDCTGSSGGDYDKGNYDSGSGWQRRSHSNKAASWGEHKDSPNQTRSVGPQETQWEKYGSDDPITSSRDDSTRDTNNTRDSTWITQNKGGDLTQQKDKSASILPVEKDDWNSQPETTTTQNDWGKGNKTGEDFGWKIPVSGNHENRQSQSEGYENSRGRGGNESNEGFENKRSRGNNYGSNEDRRRGNNYEYGEDRRRGNNYESNEDRRRNYESNDDRRRGNYGSNEGFDNRRGRGNYESNEDRRRGNNYEYEDRRRGNNYEHNEDRRRGNNYESNEDRRRGNNYESNEDRRRGNNYESNRRGNYGSNEGFDNRRGRGNYESNEDKRGRGNYGNYDSNDSFENRRGRGNFSESNDGYENSRGRNDGPNDRNARSTQSSNANVAPLNEEAWW